MTFKVINNRCRKIFRTWKECDMCNETNVNSILIQLKKYFGKLQLNPYSRHKNKHLFALRLAFPRREKRHKFENTLLARLRDVRLVFITLFAWALRVIIVSSHWQHVESVSPGGKKRTARPSAPRNPIPRRNCANKSPTCAATSEVRNSFLYKVISNVDRLCVAKLVGELLIACRAQEQVFVRGRIVNQFPW